MQVRICFVHAPAIFSENAHKLCIFTTTRFVPKVRGLPSKVSFLFSDFHEIRLNVALMSNKFFDIFNKAK